VAVEKGWVTKDEARAEVGLEPLPNGLGEAQDPIEQARQLAEATGQNQPGGGEEDEEPPARKALETKAQSLAYLPGLMEVLETMARPMLQQDLEAYFAGQAERVLSRAEGG
jgi:hypothetical protein